jgi:hypothetical protein
MLYPRRISRGISTPKFYQNYSAMRNTAGVTYLSISDVCAVNVLVVFNDNHGRKREVLSLFREIKFTSVRYIYHPLVNSYV